MYSASQLLRSMKQILIYLYNGFLAIYLETTENVFIFLSQICYDKMYVYQIKFWGNKQNRYFFYDLYYLISLI